MLQISAACYCLNSGHATPAFLKSLVLSHDGIQLAMCVGNSSAGPWVPTVIFEMFFADSLNIPTSL